jgi:diguanylate cyclase (GGDEF)-like protein
MTGCLNRRAMDAALRVRAGTGHLILLDLNGFKYLNDEYGHDAGDRVLKTVADRLRSGVGDRGAVFRMGGDEFGIVVPESDTARAGELLQQLVTSIAEPLKLGHDTVTVSAAAGMTNIGPGHPLRVFRQADQAMYLAKSRKLPYAVFGPP